MMIGVTKLSRGLLRLFLAQKSIWQYSDFFSLSTITEWFSHFEIIHASPVGEVFRTEHHSQQTERFFIAHNEPSDFPLLILGQISLLGKSVGKSYTLGR